MALIADHLNIRVDRIREIADGATIPGLGALGFEIELEKHDGAFGNVDGWLREDDGSLRGIRTEYIFDGPAGGADAERRIQAMHDYLEANPVQPTFRCSTHLHMDMRLADWNEYEKTVLAYMVFEDAMFDQQDRYRRNSNFCVPFMNNDWFSNSFGRNVLGQRDESMKFHGICRWSKYSALNLNVTGVHGTIEFRGAEALTTKDKLTALALRMLSFKAMSRAHKDMTHLEYINFLAERGIQEFIPGSFPQEYVMDAGGLAQGLSSALMAVTAGDLEGNDEVREAARREQERVLRQQQEEQQRQRQRQQDVRSALAVRVSVSADAYTGYNLAPPTTNINLRHVLSTVRALRGVGVPATVSRLVRPTAGTIAAINIIRNDIELARQFVGSLTADMLID